MRDAMKKGRMAHGEKHYAAKLSTENVKEIRKEYRLGNGVKLAKNFGVSQITILRIVKRKIWKHI
jgi:DNA-binding transcriptional regulator YiaG